mgnify:CR=1 FL=1
MIKPNKQEVGNRIKAIRLNNSYNLREFGEKIDNAADSIVRRWEKGKSLPNNKRLKLISEIGNVTVDYLLYGNPVSFLQKNFNLKSKKYDLTCLNSKGQKYLYNRILINYKFNVEFNEKMISMRVDSIFNYNELLDFAENNLDLIISDLIEESKKIINTFKDYSNDVLKTIAEDNLIYEKYLNKEGITTCDIINNYYIFRDSEIEKRIKIADSNSNNVHFIAHIINELLRFNSILSNENKLTKDEVTEFKGFLGIIKNSYPNDFTLKNTLLESSGLNDYINDNILKDIDTLIDKYDQITD